MKCSIHSTEIDPVAQRRMRPGYRDLGRLREREGKPRIVMRNVRRIAGGERIGQCTNRMV